MRTSLAVTTLDLGPRHPQAALAGITPVWGAVMGVAAQATGVRDGENCSALGSESCEASAVVWMAVGYLSCASIWGLLQDLQQ